MFLSQKEAVDAVVPILEDARDLLISQGVSITEADARICQRFDQLNGSAQQITVEALCQPVV